MSNAADTLRAILTPGTTVYTNLHRVSRSGMSRDISLHVALVTDDGTPYVRDVTYLAAEAMGKRVRDSLGGYAIRVGGCGIDMGFHLVYGLSRTLYPNGHACTGKRTGRDRCPSNDHNNDYNRLAREYEKKHAADYPTRPQHGIDSAYDAARSAYVAARQEWIATRRTYRTNRVHANGGYALSHRWL